MSTSNADGLLISLALTLYNETYLGPGRLQVKLAKRPRNPDSQFDPAYVAAHDDAQLAEKGLVRVYTRDPVSVLASARIPARDILICSIDYDSLLRPSGDALAFAFIKREYYSSQESVESCECWQTDSHRPYKSEPVMLALSLIDREVLVMKITRGTFEEHIHTIDEDFLDFIQNHTLGAIKEGSICSGITTAGWKEHRTLGPQRPLCSLHRSAEYYRISRNASLVQPFFGAMVLAFKRQRKRCSVRVRASRLSQDASTYVCVRESQNVSHRVKIL